jgi:iron complex outermembrane receptor protein
MLCRCGAYFALVAIIVFPYEPLSAQQPGATAVLEEIVVTARRREENLQNLPLSIAAFSADTMRAQGVYNVEQIGEFVPSVTLATGERANNTLIFIRGIGGGHPDPTFPFGSGMYIDGHYIPNSMGGFMSTLDIERVEVLRGPQGTLYGKNTTGGAINVISAKPGPDFSSDLTLRMGDFGQRDMRGMVNFPISDNVFARVSAAHEEYDGNYYNRTRDVHEDFTELDAVTGSLRFTPGDNWTIDTTVSLARDRDGGVGGQCAPGEEPWSRDRATWWGDDPDETQTYAVCNQDNSFGPYVLSSEKRNFSNVDTEGVFVVAEWDSGGELGSLENLSVRMSTSYRDVDFDYFHDRDFNSFPIQAIGPVGDGVRRYTTTRGSEILVEGIVNERLEFVTGFNYFFEESKSGDGRCYNLFNELYDPDNPDIDIPCENVTGNFFEQQPLREQLTGGPATAFVGNKGVWNTSYGIFGHLTYALSERWNLEVGLRYTEDTRDFFAMDIRARNVRIPDPTLPAEFDLFMNRETVLERGIISEGKKTFGEGTPLVSVTRLLEPGDWLDSGIFYLRYAEGFMTGGFNTELPVREVSQFQQVLAYQPEQVHNYEVGFKGTFADGRLRVNSAVFYMDYTNKQDFVEVDNRDFTLGPEDVVGFTWNVSEVDIYGFELEVQSRPWSGGLVQFDLGYLINEFGEYDSLGDNFTLVDLSNLAISDLSADWTANWRIQHTFNLGNGGTLTPMLGAYWQDGYEWAEGLEKDSPATRCFQGDYAKWRARLTYEPPSRNYEISLFGNNVTDELIYERCGQGRGIYVYRYAPPEAWGIEFSARWGA